MFVTTRHTRASQTRWSDYKVDIAIEVWLTKHIFQGSFLCTSSVSKVIMHSRILLHKKQSMLQFGGIFWEKLVIKNARFAHFSSCLSASLNDGSQKIDYGS